VDNSSQQEPCHELIVYFRWRDRSRVDPPATHVDAATTPVTPQGPPFISRMSKTVRGVVSWPPLMPKRRVKSLPPGATPWRSRRLAGLTAEQPRLFAARSRSKKVLLQALGAAVEDDVATFVSLKKYAELFSNHLSAIQIKALAALFG
jgi:hypothetical protein